MPPDSILSDHVLALGLSWLHNKPMLQVVTLDIRYRTLPSSKASQQSWQMCFGKLLCAFGSRCTLTIRQYCKWTEILPISVAAFRQLADSSGMLQFSSVKQLSSIGAGGSVSPSPPCVRCTSQLHIPRPPCPSVTLCKSSCTRSIPQRDLMDLVCHYSSLVQCRRSFPPCTASPITIYAYKRDGQCIFRKGSYCVLRNQLPLFACQGATSSLVPDWCRTHILWTFCVLERSILLVACCVKTGAYYYWNEH